MATGGVCGLLLLAPLASAAPAQALPGDVATEVKCGGYTIEIVDGAARASISVDRFDESLGTLIGVALEATFRGVDIYAMENMTDHPFASFTYGPIVWTYGAVDSYFGPLFPELSGEYLFQSQDHPNISAFDGENDFEGSSAFRFNPYEASPVVTQIAIPSTALTQFSGTGAVLIATSDNGHFGAVMQGIEGGQTPQQPDGTFTDMVGFIPPVKSTTVEAALANAMSVCATYTYVSTSPTVSPSASPSGSPSVTPSVSPSLTPSVSPSATSQPTGSVTTLPSATQIPGSTGTPSGAAQLARTGSLELSSLGWIIAGGAGVVVLGVLVTARARSRRSRTA